MRIKRLKFKKGQQSLSACLKTMLMVVLLIVIEGFTIAEEFSDANSWEFRICAQPHNFPASSREQPGYENVIAEIIADELNAQLTIEWTTFDRESILRALHGGACDAVIGIGESVTNVLSTVPFLRVPYVFVTRVDDGFEIVDLDDPLLANLTIGTYPGGVPAMALRNRGLQENVREYAPIPAPSGPDRDTAILDALLKGEVDVAIVYGAAAAARAQAQPGMLKIDPVRPEIDIGPSLLQMYRTWTIGVRPHDVALRTRLNIAMASRWDEIVEAISSYGVPQLDVQRPPVLVEDLSRITRVGVIVPTKTGEFHRYETVGEAARLGADLAENYIARYTEHYDIPFEILIASAPSDEAAIRAAERMLVTENVIALIGGFGFKQAKALSEIAEERGIVFFNIAAAEDELRSELCQPSTFHIEASRSMYADAAFFWFNERGIRDWYLVYEESDSENTLEDHLRATIETHSNDGRLIGSSTVRTGQILYFNEIQAIKEAKPDIVIVQLQAEDLDQFLAQAESQNLETVITVIPDVLSQTRGYYQRFREAAPRLASFPRPALWETSIQEGDAGDINDRYTSRTGEPMEPSAWAAYVAVLLVFEAAARDGKGILTAAALQEYLRDADALLGLSVGLGKDGGVSFRSWDNQMRQTLFIVQVNPDIPAGPRLSARLAMADLVGVVPEQIDPEKPQVALDLLGRGASESECSSGWHGTRKE